MLFLTDDEGFCRSLADSACWKGKTLEDLRFTFADPEDEESVGRLLSQYGLPFSDITEHLPHFILAKNGDCIVGVVGLEVMGEFGLLRSLAVAPSYLTKGLGKTLYEKILTHAQDAGVRELYLLTTSAESYFSKQGFDRVARHVVPESIQSTQEFSNLCPSTAVVMVKRINGEGTYLP